MVDCDATDFVSNMLDDDPGSDDDRAAIEYPSVEWSRLETAPVNRRIVGIAKIFMFLRTIINEAAREGVK
jgi:hypothetical protein